MFLSCFNWLIPGKTFCEKFENLEKYGFSGIDITLLEGQDLRSAESEIKKAARNSKIKIGQIIVHTEVYTQAITSQSVKQKKLDVTKQAIRMTASVGGDSSLIVPEQTAQLVSSMRPMKSPSSEEEKLLLEFLDEAAEYGQKFGITMVVEPLNRYETRFYHSPLEAMKVCQRVGRDNLKTMADFFHMNIEEANIAETIGKAEDYIHHVHLNDSNRALPGNGHIDFKSAFAAFKRIEYDRFMTLEVHRPSNPEAELPKCANYVKDLWEKS